MYFLLLVNKLPQTYGLKQHHVFILQFLRVRSSRYSLAKSCAQDISRLQSRFQPEPEPHLKPGSSSMLLGQKPFPCSCRTSLPENLWSQRRPKLSQRAHLIKSGPPGIVFFLLTQSQTDEYLNYTCKNPFSFPRTVASPQRDLHYISIIFRNTVHTWEVYKGYVQQGIRSPQFPLSEGNIHV